MIFSPQYILFRYVGVFLNVLSFSQVSKVLRNINEWRWVEVVTHFLRSVVVSIISLTNLELIPFKVAIYLLETKIAQDRGVWGEDGGLKSCLTNFF